MHKFHLTAGSFKQWAIIQFIPSMYNFDNQFWYSLEPFLKEYVSDTPPIKYDVKHQWVNHYPLRYLSFHSINREIIAKTTEKQYFTMKSQYRQKTQWSFYEVYIKQDKTILLDLKSNETVDRASN